MQRDLRAFWQRFQDEIEVAVARPAPDKLLGIRDGFIRYFHDALGRRDLPISVVPHQLGEKPIELPLTDEETIALARRQAVELRAKLGTDYHFCVGTEGGMHPVDVEGETHYFVRSWAVVIGLTGEAWGASGSVELPKRLIEGLDDQEIPFAIPGTRRKGGMISSLTRGLETRRSAVGEATFHALSSAFYGSLESHPLRRG